MATWAGFAYVALVIDAFSRMIVGWRVATSLRVVCWLRHKHPTMTWKELRQRYLAGWWPAQGETVLVDPARVHVTRYRYRGDRIPSPWTWAERMQPTDV